TLYADENFDALAWNDPSNIPTGKAITLVGADTERTITLTGNGNMFYVEGSLTLDNNLTLKGHGSNNSSLVEVYEGGSLVMKAGAKISGNTASAGGGVSVIIGGNFTMEGGEISGNTATGSLPNVPTLFLVSDGSGGGVLVQGGNFTMKGGTISGNTASGVFSGSVELWTGSGGGVAVWDGSFSKTGGTIYGNTGNANVVKTSDSSPVDTMGHAVYYQTDDSYYYRDATLGAGDNISTSQVPSSGTQYNWTKK
ncbi:MAG: hypothetical protein LBI90_05400, partial [Treponema sp.]|nr:hypothetical protein [Treponema sp.]